MSYDFRLLLPQSGVDALVTAQVEPRESGPPVPAKEARKRAIVEALMKADPALEVFQFGFDEIANLRTSALTKRRSASDIWN